MPDILHLWDLACPAAQVWPAITTTEGVRGWWTRDATLDGAVGGTGEFRFYGGARVTRVAVEAAEANRLVRWRVTESFRPEWVGTSIEFALAEASGGTMLRFAHRGFPAADDNYARCTTGWGLYLGQLKAFVETGQLGVL